MSTLNVIRSVSPPSQEEMARLYHLPEAFPDYTVTMKNVAHLALFLVEHSELTRAIKSNDQLHHLAQPALAHVLSRSIPQDASQNLTLPVSGVRIYGSDPRRRQVALTLRDPENRLNIEQTMIRDRVSEGWNWSAFSPRVAFAEIDARRSTDPVEEWVAEHAPQSVSFHRAKTIFMPSGHRRRSKRR